MTTPSIPLPEKSTPRLGQNFQAALVYASQLHQHQLRKASTVPYISHLLSVSALVLEDGGSENEAIAALLHDAVEDQGGEATADDILQCFGEEVWAIVLGCTGPLELKDQPWRERKQAYLAKIAQASDAVRRVSMADKLHNARSILRDFRREGNAVWERFGGKREGTLWFYRSFLELQEARSQGLLLQELTVAVAMLERCG